MREHFLLGPEKLCVSFSGGRTSGYMLHRILNDEAYKDWDISIAFANTGCEHPKTLEFVDKCDKGFCRPLGRRVVWLEAVVSHGKRKGIRSKEVDFLTASRKGEPFEEYVKKYGLPSPTHPHCTSRLKEDVLHDYRKNVLGWGVRGYWTAIGIRADELDRCSTKRIDRQLVYPLAEYGVNKSDVLEFWKRQSFDLELPGEHYGNCVWRWKKSLRKLYTLAEDDPGIFAFPNRIEQKYGHIHGVGCCFRGRRTAQDILIESSIEDFRRYSDDQLKEYQDLDYGLGCEESCEIGTASTD